MTSVAARADFGGTRHKHGPYPPRALRGSMLGWLGCGAHLVPGGGHQQARSKAPASRGSSAVPCRRHGNSGRSPRGICRPDETGRTKAYRLTRAVS